VSETPEDLIRQAAALVHRAAELNRQITRDELAGMSVDQVNQARRDGRLKDLIATAPPGPTEAQKAARASLQDKTPDQINQARRAGELDALLGKKEN
jgi:hypothetical protein